MFVARRKGDGNPRHWVVYQEWPKQFSPVGHLVATAEPGNPISEFLAVYDGNLTPIGADISDYADAFYLIKQCLDLRV
jgi:hypothetical protein